MLIFVDVEAGPALGQLPDLHDFGAVEYVPVDDPRRRVNAGAVVSDVVAPGIVVPDPGPVGRTFRGTTHAVTDESTYENRVVLGAHDYTFPCFAAWLAELRFAKLRPTSRVSFVSDNVAFDWQWVNYYFWKHCGRNPFGHSGRRIGDFYAGLRGDFRRTQEWKRLRVTRHDHNPVHDAMGNVEAFDRIVRGER